MRGENGGHRIEDKGRQRMQAAEACGFSNRAHFYRIFRQFVEHLPSMEAKAEHNL